MICGIPQEDDCELPGVPLGCGEEQQARAKRSGSSMYFMKVGIKELQHQSWTDEGLARNLIPFERLRQWETGEFNVQHTAATWAGGAGGCMKQ